MAAGYAPVYPATPLDEPEMDAARQAIDLRWLATSRIRRWRLTGTGTSSRRIGRLASSGGARRCCSPAAQRPAAEHAPQGLAGRISNASQWREHAASIAAAGRGDRRSGAGSVAGGLRAFPVSGCVRQPPVIHSSVAFPCGCAPRSASWRSYDDDDIWHRDRHHLAELAIETLFRRMRGNGAVAARCGSGLSDSARIASHSSRRMPMGGVIVRPSLQTLARRPLQRSRRRDTRRCRAVGCVAPEPTRCTLRWRNA